MAKKKKSISYGNVDLDHDEFSPKYEKIRITTFVDLDIITSLKKKSKKLGVGYQTLLNDILRKSVIGNESPRVDLEDIVSRLENLEKKVI